MVLCLPYNSARRWIGAVEVREAGLVGAEGGEVSELAADFGAEHRAGNDERLGARVLVGGTVPLQPDQSLRMPPEMPDATGSMTGVRYDSVTGMGGGGGYGGGRDRDGGGGGDGGEKGAGWGPGWCHPPDFV